MPWFGELGHGKVFINEAAFTGVPPVFESAQIEVYNAYDIAGVMVHEAVHAWEYYSIMRMVEDPNSDFRRLNTAPEGLSYLTNEWRGKYFPAFEVQAEEYVLEHSPTPLCLSELLKRTNRRNMDENSGDHPKIPGTDSDHIELVGEPLP